MTNKQLKLSSKITWRIKILLISIAVILAIALMAILWIFWAVKPTGSFSIAESKGNIKQFADSLQQKRIIRSALIFRIMWRSGTLQEGYYELKGGGTKNVIIQVKQGPNLVKATIPEGFSAGQIAQRLGKNGFDPTQMYRTLIDYEGKLFPDTYYINKSASPEEIIKQMTDDFNKRTAQNQPTDEQLIIASIVEREAKKDDERAKIASVYSNRLKQGMKLEADPTVQYARDEQMLQSKVEGVDLWQPLSAEYIRTLDSPFNTYKFSGLPPAPICNPGIKSIEAAQNPTPDFSALYFFHDKNGDIHFSNTSSEHQAAIKRYGL